MNIFKRILLLGTLISSLGYFIPVNAQIRIDVPGSVDCSDGHYSEACGWPSGPIYENPEPGGGGGVGGAGGAGPKEPQTAYSMNWNRQPECPREEQWVTALLDTIAVGGAPIGDILPITVTDPDYPDGQWVKVQALGYSYDTHGQPSNTQLEFRYTAHYMYNVTTGQVHQMKLKNSREYGCVGRTVSR